MLLRTAKTEQQRYPSCKRHTIITQKENDNIDLKTKLSILCDGRENQSFFGWEVACLCRCATFYTLLDGTSRLFADCMAVWMTCCGATVGGNGYGWTEPIVPQKHFIFVACIRTKACTSIQFISLVNSTHCAQTRQLCNKCLRFIVKHVHRFQLSIHQLSIYLSAVIGSPLSFLAHRCVAISHALCSRKAWWQHRMCLQQIIISHFCDPCPRKVRLF